jgi:hypothetical protein
MTNQVRIGWRANTPSSISYLISSLTSISTPILDTYTGSSVVHSLRKLKSAYTGYAIRVRRSSDNAETDIGFSGLSLDTTSLLTFVGTGNGFVTTWYDQSGTAKNATQTTASKQPQIVSSGSVILRNTKPTIKFDGVDDYLFINSAVTVSLKTNFTVTCLDGNSVDYDGIWLYGNITAPVEGIPVSAETNYLSLYPGGRRAFSKGLTTRVYFSNQKQNATTYTTWSQGVQLPNVNGTLNLVSLFSPTSITGDKYMVYGGDPYNLLTRSFNGTISECVFFENDLTNNVNEINSNINNYYSIYTQDTNPLNYVSYSFRKLNPDYTGYAMRVRRSIDNQEMDIPFVNGVLDESSIRNFVGYQNMIVNSDSMNSTWNYLHLGVSGFGLTLNSTTAPDSTITASKITDSTAWANAKIISQATSNTYGIGHSWNSSVHFKMVDSGIRYIALCNNITTTPNANDIYVVFDLLDKVVTHSNFSTDTNTGYSIQELGNGWLRCSIWGKVTQAVTRNQVKVIRGTNNSPTFTYVSYRPSQNRDFYIWGFQYTQGEDSRFLTLKPYTKTTTIYSGTVYMVTWYDQSGNGRNLSNSTASGQSQIVSNGFFNTINGKSAVSLSSSWIGSFGVTNPDLDMTMLMVFQLSSNYTNTVEYQLLGGSVYDNQSKLSIKNNKYFISNQTSSAVGLSSVGDVTTNPVISSLIFSTTDKLRINGNEVISGNAGGFNLSTGVMVGRGYMNRPFLGNISELVVWYNNPKEYTISSLESNLNSYYAVY